MRPAHRASRFRAVKRILQGRLRGGTGDWWAFWMGLAGCGSGGLRMRQVAGVQT